MNALEDALVKTFEDFRMSSGEKHGLKELLSPLSEDKESLFFVRNRAFDLVSDQMRNSSEHHLESVKWLSQVVKLVEGVGFGADAIEESVYFSPGTECAAQIIGHIQRARKSIDVCVFTISDDNISNELIDAHKRGITVRIITDDEKTEDTGSDVHRMARKGVPVRVDNNPSHMHHKFAIFDSRIVLNGSFNWTRSASRYNHEDITISNHPELLAGFTKRFETLWKKFGTR